MSLSSSKHFSDGAGDRAAGNAAGFRVGLSCLLVLFVGLLAVAGLIYYLSQVFAGWLAEP